MLFNKRVKIILFTILLILLVILILFITKNCKKNKDYFLDWNTINEKITKNTNIPKNIYITQKHIDIIPQNIITYIQNKYKDYKIEFHSEQSCRDFLYKNFRATGVNIYDNLNKNHKNIFWGLCILYFYGGYYINIENIPNNLSVLINENIMASSNLDKKLYQYINNYSQNKIFKFPDSNIKNNE